MKMRMLVGIGQFLLLTCVVFAAVPGVAAVISDTLTVYNSQGNIVQQVVALEGQEGVLGATIFTLPPGFAKFSLFGQATVLCESLPCDASSPISNFSDIVGIVNTGMGPLRLGFSSDDENGLIYGPQGAIFLLEVPGFAYDVTNYLDPVHVRAGFTATFVSDADVSPVPEPTSLVLLGSGLLGLAGYSRRFLR